MQPECDLSCFGNEGRPTGFEGSTVQQYFLPILISPHPLWQSRAWNVFSWRLIYVASSCWNRGNLQCLFLSSLFSLDYLLSPSFTPLLFFFPLSLKSQADFSQDVLTMLRCESKYPSELFFVAVHSIYFYGQKVKPMLCMTSLEYGIVRKKYFCLSFHEIIHAFP